MQKPGRFPGWRLHQHPAEASEPEAPLQRFLLPNTKRTQLSDSLPRDFYMGGTPKNRGVFPPNHPWINRVFHFKPSILGYHYFWNHPYKKDGGKCDLSPASQVDLVVKANGHHHLQPICQQKRHLCNMSPYTSLKVSHVASVIQLATKLNSF